MLMRDVGDKLGLKETDAGIILPIKVVPKAHRNEILEWENGELNIRLTAVPEKGDANHALVRFLAKHLGISPSNITLVFGPTSRHKRVRITGLSLKDIVLALPSQK